MLPLITMNCKVPTAEYYETVSHGRARSSQFMDVVKLSEQEMLGKLHDIKHDSILVLKAPE